MYIYMYTYIYKYLFIHRYAHVCIYILNVCLFSALLLLCIFVFPLFVQITFSKNRACLIYNVQYNFCFCGLYIPLLLFFLVFFSFCFCFFVFFSFLLFCVSKIYNIIYDLFFFHLYISIYRCVFTTRFSKRQTLFFTYNFLSDLP